MVIQGKPDIEYKREMVNAEWIGELIGTGKNSWTKQETENKTKRPVETEFSKP